MKQAAPHQNAPPRSAILFVHGDFGDGFESWGHVSEHIGQPHQAIIVDRPGFGESLPLDARFSIAGEAASLLQIADEMDLESFHLAGHSYGGLIALEMAVTRPETIRSLHLIEPPLLDLLPEQPEVQAMARRLESIQAEHGDVGAEKTTEAFFAMIGAAHVPERQRGTPDWKRLTGYADRFVRGEPAGNYTREALDRLPAAIPVGLYSGGRSHAALRAVTHELSLRIKEVRFTDVPTAGHAVQMAGVAFLDPFLQLVAESDAAWEERVSAAAADSGWK